MLKSKPVIIVAAILAGILGLWIGVNIFTSGLAQILGIALIAVIGVVVWKSLRGNRTVETIDDAVRAGILTGKPTTGARVFVYREGFIGKLAGIDIAIDGTHYAQLKSPRSVAIDIPAGEHTLVATVAGKNQPPFAFSAAEGEALAVRIGMGVAGPEISHESDSGALRAKLATIPMVRADRAATDPVAATQP